MEPYQNAEVCSKTFRRFGHDNIGQHGLGRTAEPVAKESLVLAASEIAAAASITLQAGSLKVCEYTAQDAQDACASLMRLVRASNTLMQVEELELACDQFLHGVASPQHGSTRPSKGCRNASATSDCEASRQLASGSPW